MLSYEEAEDKMAHLMKARSDFQESVRKEYEEGKSDFDNVFTKERHDQVEKLDWEVKKYGEELASMPQFIDIMEPWMVDVMGNEGVTLSQEIFGSILGELIREENTAAPLDRCGGLAVAVRSFLEQWGFLITDSGMGCCGWHLGVPCNTPTMKRLCAMLHTQFAKAIKAELIKVVVYFWEWKLPTLRNDNDAQEYFLRKEAGEAEA